MAVAVAGTVTQNAATTPGAMEDDPLDGVSLPNLFGEEPTAASGAGIAGSGAVDVIEDTTLAYINADTNGAATVGTVGISATNNQTVVNVTGGVTIAIKAGGNSAGSNQVGAAFSANQDTADTEAFIKGADIDSTAALVSGTNQVSLTATREGVLDSFSAALSAATTNSNAFAGSVSINRVTDTTDADVDSATLTAANVGLSATDDPSILAIGGGASFTAGNKGIGGSVGFNQMVGTTMAAIEGTNSRSTVNLSGNLSINADDADTITAVGVSAGVSTASNSQAGAFTIGINIISTNTAVFSRTNPMA